MTEDIKNLTVLIEDFLNSLDNRSALFILNKEVYQVLEWNLTVWKLRQKEFGDWYRLSIILETIIKKIAYQTSKMQYLFSTIFLKNFQQHMEAHKKECFSIDNKTRYYIEDMLRIFYQILFEFEEKAELSEKDYMWSCFPNKWKITKSNLDDKDNIISWISLREFLGYVNQRLTTKKDFDPQLNDVLINLFPEAEPATWAKILIFRFLPYIDGKRVWSVITTRRTFGYSMDTVVGSSKEEIEIKWEARAREKKTNIENAYELAAKIFPAIFTEENLESYIREATNLVFSENSTEESNRQEYVRIFQGIQKVLRNKQ